MKKENTIPELLSPAGSEEALHAAVDSGADAVYLGSKAFGARASAVNFDDETLTRAVEYAHLHHARVHVTVNTLVKEKEFSGVRETLRAIAAAKADAVIVQDLGVWKFIREHFPDLPILIRTPVIPGFNDSKEDLLPIADLVRKLGCEYELLKYHRLGEPKYASLHRFYPMEEVELSEERFEELKQVCS